MATTQIQVRRDTATDWSNENPTLASGEIGFEIDTGKYKIGDGSTTWDTLGYAKYTDIEARGAIDDIFGSDGKADKDIDLDSYSIPNQSTSWADFNNLDLSNVNNAAQADFATFGQATVNLADGDSLQLARTHIPTGQAIKIIKAAISQKDGTYGTSGLDIEAYNETDAATIYSFDASGTTVEGLDEGSYTSPLATGGTGDEIIIRIVNGTGSAQDIQAWLAAVIE